MTAYIVKGEILHAMEGWNSKPFDEVKYLPRQYPDQDDCGISKEKRKAVVWRTYYAIKNHSMEAVINALEQKGYK